MSEVKPSDSSFESTSAPFPAPPDPFFDELIDAASERAATKPQREGLPPTYKMRNAHYVDELEARDRRLADPEPRPQSQTREAATSPVPRPLVALALTELCRGLEGLSSCFKLLSPAARPLRDRLGLELAQVEARRAGRASRSLRVLLDEPRLTRRDVSFQDLLQRALDDLQDELRLARIELTVDSWDPRPVVWGDEHLLSIAVSGTLGALVAILESAEPPTILRASGVPGHGLVTLRLHADGAVFSSPLSRLFDVDWVDRPGGVGSAVALAAARWIAQLHGGRLEAAAQPAGGFAVSLSLPVPS